MKKVLLGLSLTASLLLADNFTLKSNSLKGQLTNKQVFNGFGCSGENISPELSWEDAPKGTKSFAVTVYDKDAPTGSGWWHWVVFNIPSNITKLEEGFGNKPSKGVIQSITDFGVSGFGGACPPIADKAHEYIFTVHALDVEKLELDEKATPALVGFMINSHSLGKASVVSYYDR